MFTTCRYLSLGLRTRHITIRPEISNVITRPGPSATWRNPVCPLYLSQAQLCIAGVPQSSDFATWHHLGAFRSAHIIAKSSPALNSTATWPLPAPPQCLNRAQLRIVGIPSPSDAATCQHPGICFKLLVCTPSTLAGPACHV